jgi:hypothetical protein
VPNYIVGQTSALSCGAACLLCTALELQSTPTVAGLAATTPLALLISSGAALAASNAWLAAIYDISGAAAAGYSLPSGIIAAAQYLGLNATVIMAQTNTMSFLQKQYPHEIAACRPNTIPVAAARLGDLRLAQNQRAMHCVRIGQTTAVHWVLQRNDNSYMDPAGGPVALDIARGGDDRTDRTTLKATGQPVLGVTLAYHGTGLAIRLQV